MRLKLVVLTTLLAACPPVDEPPASEPQDTEVVPEDTLVGTCASSPATAATCVEHDRYVAHLEAAAVPRGPGSAGWQAAQDLCANTFASLGLTVERQAYGTGVNIIGVKEGTSSERRQVIVSAHYDHVTGCEGADDNASGVAGTLEAARVLAEGTWENDMVVACWDEEELGLIGSDAYASRASAEGHEILAMFSLEMIAYKDDTPNSQELPFGFEAVFPEPTGKVIDNDSRGDFIAVVYDTAFEDVAQAFEEHAGELPVVRIPLTPEQAASPFLGDLQRSDHAVFWRSGYPAAMVTDTANFRYGGYHCSDGPDAVSRLDTLFATDVVRATVAAAAHALVPSQR